jgi:hypothetical protein
MALVQLVITVRRLAITLESTGKKAEMHQHKFDTTQHEADFRLKEMF